MLSPNNYVANALKNLDEYISFCTSTASTTVINQYERLAVERFLELRKRYTYKESEVKKVVRFCSLLNLPLKSEIKQFQLLDFQIFWIANLYGLYTSENERLFTEAYIEIAKKQGKTSFFAAISIYECIADLPEINANCLLVASSRDQARVALSYIQNIIENSPAIESYFKINKNIIYNKTSNTLNKIEVRASDAGKIQGLNTSFSLIDELAFHKNDELKNRIKSGMIARKNHLQVSITTPSNNRLTSPAYEIREIGINVLTNKIQNDSLFVQVFTLNSREDISFPERWRQSCPAINQIFDLDSLVKEYELCKHSSTKLNSFLTDNLSLWIDDESGGENWISDDVIKENMQDFEFNTGLTLTCGTDLSHQRDLSCCAKIQHNPADDKFYVDVQFIFPHNERKKIKEHGSIDLSRWFITSDKPDNYILQSDKPFLDQEQVLEVFRKWNEESPIDAIGFDPFLSGRIEYEIQSRLGLDVVNVPMNWKLTPAIQFAERLLLSGRLIMKRNPVLRWNFQSTIVTQTDQGNLYLKKRNRESIDGVVAIVIALSVWMERNQSRYQFLLDGFEKIYNKDDPKAA